MDDANTSPMEAPRMVSSGGLRIFGPGQRYSMDAKEAIPSQWDRFVPYLGKIEGQIGRTAYGVICNSDKAGNFEYICGVEVSEFPAHPPEFSRLQIPPATYAVFQHREHISTITATWDFVWNQGLRDAGHQAGDGPAFERYGERFDGRTGLGGVELWVPVKG